MPNPAPPFSPAEYARRLALVRAAMERQGFDALFIEDPANMAWLTGYDGWSFYVHQGVIVRPEGDPLWWGRGQDGRGAARTVWMADDLIRPYPDNYVQSTERHAMQHLGRLLDELGFGRARIGVEMEGYFYSARAHQVLCASLPGAAIGDASGLVNWQRLVKSAEEIAFMRRAARIVEAAMDGVFERIEPGLPKNLLVAETLADLVRGVGEDWGDYAAIVPLMPSGADASASHLTWDGRPFRAGEMTFFELAGCYRRYHVPFCRSVFLGDPPGHVRRAEAALAEGLEAGLEAARPGNRACDIAEALAAPLARAGIERGARCGYPVGLGYPPDWGEHTVSLREEDRTVLQPGMCFHFMPGLWMEDWGMEITETILIAEDGPAQCFCDRPRRLFVKP